eukprot:jgi/Tetstr1/438579/TSEL_027130.t1
METLTGVYSTTLSQTLFRDHCVHDLSVVVRREVDGLFHQAGPLGNNTVPKDDHKDMVPDAELSLPAFNVVTGSLDPRSLKSMLLEVKTMRFGVKYTAHNTEPGQKGYLGLRDILDMSEYTGHIVFGKIDSSAIQLPKMHGTFVDHPRTHMHAWPGL